jgi:subtilisin family serine protease
MRFVASGCAVGSRVRSAVIPASGGGGFHLKRHARFLSLLSVIMLCALYAPAHAAEDAIDRAFEPIPGVREHSGQLIVRPRQPDALIAQGLSERQAAQRTQTARARLAPHLVKSFATVDEHIVRIPAGRAAKQFAQTLLATGDYEYVVPDWLVSPAGLEPNDTFYIDQWYLPHIGADWAWYYTQGDPSVIVAIVDTGVDGTHPELTQAMVPGFNAVNEMPELEGGQVSDVNGHGTRVAGIVAAEGNNGAGLCGVGWVLSIMPVRASNASNGMALISDLNAGARWAVEHGAKVANVSYNGIDNDSIQTTGEFIRSIGGVLIWAVGNGSFEIQGHDHADVIVVGATDVFDQFASFSNYGELVDLVAPGTPIRTTVIGGGYAYVSGTSYAAPIVSGVAALMFAGNPSISPSEIEQSLVITAIDFGEPGEDDYFGHGRIDAFEAVKMSRACPADVVTSSTSQPPPDGRVDAADLAYLLSQWGPGAPSLADVASSMTFVLPADGEVNAADLAILLGSWGECP